MEIGFGLSDDGSTLLTWASTRSLSGALPCLAIGLGETGQALLARLLDRFLGIPQGSPA